MKKLILLFFLTLICADVNAQEFDISAKWKVKEVISPKTIENADIRDLVNGFSESTFHLKEDKSIKISSLNPTQGFMYFTMMADDAVWNYKENILILSDKKSKGLIMKILVKIKEGKTIFTFDGTNLVLEVFKYDSSVYIPTQRDTVSSKTY